MLRLRLPLIAFTLLCLIATVARPATAEVKKDDALVYFENLPGTNPYRDVFIRFQSLPKEERDVLRAWSDGYVEEGEPLPTLTPDQIALARELSEAIVAAGAAPATAREAWPLVRDPNDPDNLAALFIPGIGSVRTLAKIATKDATSLPPGDAAAVYAAVVQLGRQQRSGATLIEQLLGVAVEGIAQAEAAKRLNEFSAEELAQLSSLWDQLKAPPSNAEALSGEREIFFRPMVENILVPGLRALLEDSDSGQEPDSSEPDSDFTKDLRLSGLIDLGGGQHRILLENTRTGESFALDLGRTSERIQLVSLDYEKRIAVIRSGGNEAEVHLESKRIIRKKNHAYAVRKMFETFDIMGDTENEKSSLEKILARIRAHPGGVDGYAKDLLAAYQAGVDKHIELAESPRAPKSENAKEPADDPLLAMTVPTIGKLARTFNSTSTQTLMFKAAIQHRLGQLSQSVDPFPLFDPWAGKLQPFDVKPAANGAGFVITSRYEVSPGEPVTYKFAAPDAGFIRVPVKP